MGDRLISRNPATGEILTEIPVTSHERLPEIFIRARAAQRSWSMLPVKNRAAHLLQIRETLLDRAEDLVSIISAETGKPRFESLANEILPAIDTLTHFAKRTPRLLKPKRIPLSLMRHRKSTIHYWPVGVVVIIAPWNYPFWLPFSSLAMALAAGNAVIFKPSEITSSVGRAIQDLIDNSGIPSDLVQTVYGEGPLGAALIEQKPDKIFFTGSTETGKKIMAQAAKHLIPVNLELGGKDPMIVLPDADLDFASSMAIWGGFSNSGQMCASVERILVHESVAQPFTSLLREKLAKLKQGPSAGDLSVTTAEKQTAIYETQLQEARQAGAEIVTGGELSPDRRYLKPTIIAGPKVESLKAYREETFGPVVALTTFKSVAEAVRKANDSEFGLTASIVTKNVSLGEQIAHQLEAGTVTINEVAYTAGLGETPWGGVKQSGFGRTHSDLAMYEFVHIRHVHKPRTRLLVFKSLWWFPYTPYQYATFRNFLNLYRRHWSDKLRAFPHFLWNLVHLIKEEKRL